MPNRNGLFLNIAASFAEGLGAAAILTGFNREEAETFPDNSASFVEAANGSLRFSTLSGVRVESPTLQMNKLEIVQEGLRVQLPFELTWSCYEGFDKMCGACESCLRSKRAYHEGGVWERMKRLFNT